MKVFVITNYKVQNGAQITEMTRGDSKFPAVTVGEEGRGRKLAFLSVVGNAPSQGRLEAAEIITRPGKFPLLRAIPAQEESGEALIIFRIAYGFRGEAGIRGLKRGSGFPFQVLAEGRIADGIAGAMASAPQYIAVVKAGVPWVQWRSGRLYGDPSSMAGVFDGRQVHLMSAADITQLPETPFDPFLSELEMNGLKKEAK